MAEPDVKANGWKRDLAIGSVVTLAYFVTGWLGTHLPFLGDRATLIWAPSGIALAVLARLGLRFWPSIAVGAFAVNIAVSANVGVASAVAMGNVLEAVVAIRLIRRLDIDLGRLSVPQSLIALLAIGVLGPAIAAGIGAGALALAGLVRPADGGAVFRAWWLGDYLGAVMVGGMLLALSYRAWPRWNPRRVGEAAILVACSVVLGVLTVHNPSDPSHVAMSLAFPVLAWAAVRFEFLGASSTLLINAASATADLLLRGGELPAGLVQECLWEVYTYHAGLALSGCLLAASIIERRRALSKLRHSQAELEEKVRQRTTDLSESSAALQRSEAQFRVLVENAAMGIAIVRNMRLKFFNQACERMFDVTDANRGSDNRLDRFIAPHEMARIADYAARRMRGETVPSAYEIEAMRADGRPLWLLVSAARVDWVGKPSTLISLVDQTDRRLAEVALRESEERFRSLAESLPGIVFEADVSGRIIFANRPGLVATGYTEADVAAGVNAVDIIDPADRPRAVESLRAVMEGRPVSRHEYLARRKDGSPFNILIYSTPAYRANQVVGVRGYLIDITERKRVEDALRRSNAELEQFASVASHDLRTPVNAIRLLLEVLDLKFSRDLPDAAQTLVANACSALQMMDKTILDLLEYSRLGREDRPMEPLALGDVVDAALLNLQADIENSQATVRVARSLPDVMGNESDLVRLFQNLLGNAIKYRVEGRRLVIRIESTPRDDGGWAIAVHDNGSGIEPDERELIFQPFQRPSRHGHYEGTGIGLAVCFKVVEQHGGTIWVDSAPGEGSSFYFTLRGAQRKRPTASDATAA